MDRDRKLFIMQIMNNEKEEFGALYFLLECGGGHGGGEWVCTCARACIFLPVWDQGKAGGQRERAKDPGYSIAHQHVFLDISHSDCTLAFG